jgi:hypothetical protein
MVSCKSVATNLEETFSVSASKQKSPTNSGIFSEFMVRWRGLEPPRLSAHGPQPCLSANSSTSAWARRIIIGLPCLSSKLAKV